MLNWRANALKITGSCERITHAREALKQGLHQMIEYLEEPKPPIGIDESPDALALARLHRRQAAAMLKMTSRAWSGLPTEVMDPLLKFIGVDRYFAEVRFHSRSSLPVLEVLRSISTQHPHVRFCHRWAEVKMAFCGQCTIEGGVELQEECFERQVEEGEVTDHLTSCEDPSCAGCYGSDEGEGIIDVRFSGPFADLLEGIGSV